MSLFEDITKRVTETAKELGKKSGEFVEVQKLRLSIGAEEDKIEKINAEIGKLVYEAFARGEEVDASFKELCEKIETCKAAIAEMKEKILELKSVKVCPACGIELELDAAFCSKCGAKQEIPQPPAPEPTDKTCGACGAKNALEAEFCTKCGTKLE